MSWYTIATGGVSMGERMRITGGGSLAVAAGLFVGGGVGGLADPTSAIHLVGDLRIDNTGTAGKALWREPSGSGSNVTTIAAGAQGGDINYTWPLAAPSQSGQVLAATTAGAWSWASAPAYSAANAIHEMGGI